MQPRIKRFGINAYLAQCDQITGYLELYSGCAAFFQLSLVFDVNLLTILNRLHPD